MDLSRKKRFNFGAHEKFVFGLEGASVIFQDLIFLKVIQKYDESNDLLFLFCFMETIISRVSGQLFLKKRKAAI